MLKEQKAMIQFTQPFVDLMMNVAQQASELGARKVMEELKKEGLVIDHRNVRISPSKAIEMGLWPRSLKHLYNKIDAGLLGGIDASGERWVTPKQIEDYLSGKRVK